MKKITELCRNSSGKSDDQFIGLKINSNDFEIVFPYGYRIPSDEIECKKSIKSLIISFSLAKEMYIDNKIILSNEYGGEIRPFLSYFWIVSDFLKNGLYLNKYSINKYNTNGKINWKKTLNDSPVFSNNGIFFQKIFVDTYSTNESILSKIQIFCIHKALKYIGFLYPNIKLSNDIITIDENNSRYYISLIDKEINNTFIDRNVLLLRHMKKILLKLDKTDKHTNLFSFGVNSYNYVWEKLIKFHFGNRDETYFYPYANWYIHEKKEYKDSYLRPDCVLEVNNTLFILDAKHYQYGICNEFDKLPNTDSIQKQITYGEYAEKLEPKKDDIFNAFLLPYNKEDNPFNKNENISIIGYARSSWELSHTKFSYPKVYAVLLDTKYIVDYYTQKTENIKNILSNKIINANKNLKKA